MILAYSIADQSFERSTSLGIFNVSVALLGELAARQEVSGLITYRDPALHIDPETARAPAIQIRDVPIGGMVSRIAWEQWGATAAAWRDGADWLLLPKGFSSFARRPKVKVAAYVHDIMAATYFERYPAHGGRLKQAYFARCLGTTLARATAVFTNTEFTKGEILDWARRKGIAVRPEITVAGYGLPNSRPPPDHRREIIACDVRDAPHKRSDLALSFLRRWCEDTGFGGRVVLIGRPPQPLPAPPLPTWEFPGRVSGQDYSDLMRSSLAHVHFTEYEGFGLPPIEAIMNGAPAVYSEIGATSEVMGGLGFPFLNASYDSFAGAMDRALRADPETIVSWQQALRARHNWRTVGDRIIAVLENR